MEDRFIIINEIDEGSFGFVLKAKHKDKDEIVAIKRIKKKYTSWDECVALREVKSQRKQNHQNIVKLQEALKAKDELFLVFEYVDSNQFNLYNDFKKQGKNMPESQIKTIIYQTACGLAYMHKNGFFHRDIKPENLLINPKNVIKIADFGLAREIRSLPPYTDYVSTRWYRAPEILLKSTNYNSPIDIFALGCIMAELYLLAPLFSGSSEVDQLNKICSVQGTPPKSWTEGYKQAGQIHMQFPNYTAIPLNELIKNASPEGIELMQMCLQYDGFKRPSAQQVLSHPYFTKSIISGSSNIWGAQSLRERNSSNLGPASMYKPAKSNVFNIQNKKDLDFKNDIDLEFDNDINEIMNKDFNKSLRPEKNNENKNKTIINNDINKGIPTDNSVNTFKNKGANISAFNKTQTDEFDVFGIPSTDNKKTTPKLDANTSNKDDFGSIFSNQAIRNQNHYNSHSSGVIGKEVGMGKFNNEFTMSNQNARMGDKLVGSKVESTRDKGSYMSNVGLRGVGTNNVYGNNPNSSINKIINNNSITQPQQLNEWQI